MISDCGANCYTDYTTYYTYGGGYTTYGYYYSCYYDSAGAAISYGSYCDYYASYCGYYWTAAADITTCQQTVYGCNGVATCYIDAICGTGNTTCDNYFAYYSSSTTTTGGTTTTGTTTGGRKKLKAVPAIGSFTFTSAVSLFGETTVGTSYPIYCDHSHLYDFYYSTVTPHDSTDATTDLVVTGHSMIGFPGLCSYSDGLAI